MRHRKRGRILGRSPSHRKAMLKNLASSLILTESELLEIEDNAPKVKGRVITTLHKAKEVRPLVEKCVTIARKSLAAEEAAREYETNAERNTSAWQDWRKSDRWQKWADARAPVVAARRRALQLLGNKEAVRVLFDEIAPRFEDRNGGYTRILRLATPRLGDNGTRAILEFVGKHDREQQVSQAPSFDSDEPETTTATEEPVAEETVSDEPAAEETTSPEASAESEEAPEEKKE